MVVIKILGIVAEFNPFHSGHAYLIEQARALGASHIVCVMSGNFVQRGDIAICSKVTRAEMALRTGVDLVLELPITSATATAQRFARGAVATLAALGCVDGLVFGSECADVDALKNIAKALEDTSVMSRTREIMQDGTTFAAARQQALTECGYNGEILRNPNDTLAVNYIEAINSLGINMTPIAIKRIGVAHDGGTDGNYASASYIRELIENNGDISPYIPADALKVLKHEIEVGRAPFEISKLESACLAKLRTMTPEQMSRLPDISEGIENRIYRAAREQTTVTATIDEVKSKRYTHARIRRIILSALLGIDRATYTLDPQYVRVLGMNSGGRKILSEAQPTLPLISRVKDAVKLGRYGAVMLDAEQRADNLAAMASPTVQPCESTLSQIVIL